MMSLSGRCVRRLIHAAAVSSTRQLKVSQFGQPALPVRQFTLSACRHESLVLGTTEEKGRKDDKPEGKRGHKIKEVSLQESLRYMESEAFKLIYGDEAVWKYYRRNFKGHFAPKPRVSCTRKGVIESASPCPLCRDDYLVVSYKNTALLQQFVSDITGEPLDPKITGLCMKQHKHVKLEVARAQDYGLMEKAFHFRKYDYDYYKELADTQRQEMIKFLSSVKPDSVPGAEVPQKPKAEKGTKPRAYTEGKTKAEKGMKTRADSKGKTKADTMRATKAESEAGTKLESEGEIKAEPEAETKAENKIEQSEPKRQDKETDELVDNQTESDVKQATGKISKDMLRGLEKKTQGREKKAPSSRIVHARVKPGNKQEVMSQLLKDKYNLK